MNSTCLVCVPAAAAAAVVTGEAVRVSCVEGSFCDVVPKTARAGKSKNVENVARMEFQVLQTAFLYRGGESYMK